MGQVLLEPGWVADGLGRTGDHECRLRGRQGTRLPALSPQLCSRRHIFVSLADPGEAPPGSQRPWSLSDPTGPCKYPEKRTAGKSPPSSPQPVRLRSSPARFLCAPLPHALWRAQWPALSRLRSVWDGRGRAGGSVCPPSPTGHPSGLRVLPCPAAAGSAPGPGG